MIKTGVSVLVVFVLVSASAVFADDSGSAPKDVACYVCMGRDMENCNTGETQCHGYCFKTIDTLHDVIVKGCVPSDYHRSVGSEQPDWSPNITLYWSKDENGKPRKIKGRTNFCNKDHCNSGFLVNVNRLLLAGLTMVSIAWLWK